MNYMKITYPDIANGPGCRVTLWVAGCSHQCPGCHNPQTWDQKAGKPLTNEVIEQVIELLRPDYISGLTFSGGDPLFGGVHSNLVSSCDWIATIAGRVREEYHDKKSIWLWTGYLWDEIKDWKRLPLIDIIVDGPFVQELKDITLPYCGSSNQRVIDVKKSLEQNEVVLWKEY